jgi:2-methylaconitate cis-trans-isomerase PrpF
VNPIVLLAAADIGLTGTEIEAIECSAEIKRMLEAIRCRAAVQAGIAATEDEATRRSQAVPKIAVLAAPAAYTTSGGRRLAAGEMDLAARAMSMGTLHRSIAVSGAGALAGAAMIPGTVAYDLVADAARRSEMLRVGHPGGVIEVKAAVEIQGDRIHYKEAVLGRPRSGDSVTSHDVVPAKARNRVSVRFKACNTALPPRRGEGVSECKFDGRPGRVGFLTPQPLDPDP